MDMMDLRRGLLMWTVTLTRADGRQIMRETRGAFPATEPEPTEEEPTEE